MVRIKPSLCFDLIGDQFDSAEMLPHADYQNSAIPTSPCLPGDVKRENVKYTTGSAQELKGWMHWSIRKKKKKICPGAWCHKGEAARLPVAETNLGSVGVRARQGPGRDSGRSALAQHSRVRMRRRQSPLAHRSRRSASAPAL